MLSDIRPPNCFDQLPASASAPASKPAAALRWSWSVVLRAMAPGPYSALTMRVRKNLLASAAETVCEWNGVHVAVSELVSTTML